MVIKKNLSKETVTKNSQFWKAKTLISIVNWYILKLCFANQSYGGRVKIPSRLDQISTASLHRGNTTKRLSWYDIKHFGGEDLVMLEL